MCISAFQCDPQTEGLYLQIKYLSNNLEYVFQILTVSKQANLNPVTKTQESESLKT